MRVVSLGSSSSGNSLLIEAGPLGRTRLLVDAGLGIRILTARLQSVGVQPAQLQGVLVTHEHSDHILGLPVLIKRYSTPIIADPRTYVAIKESLTTGLWRAESGKLVQLKTSDGTEPLDVVSTTITLEQYATTNTGRVGIQESPDPLPATPPTIPFPIGTSCAIGDIEVTSFSTSHDAVAPCGYLLSAGGCRVCIVTDTGEVTPAMLDNMQHADLLIIEANHDRQRLLRGPYPYHLKQRILSPSGHLSNDQAAEAILQTWRTDSIRWLWLAHISRTNNTPTLALESIRTILQAANANLAQIHLSALPPSMGRLWDSTQLWHTASLWHMDG